MNAVSNHRCPPEIRAALSGPWPSIHTPFDRQYEIDFASLRTYVDVLIEASHSKAIVLTWGDSLFSLLSDDEIAQVTKTVVEQAKGRAFVVAAGPQSWTGRQVEFAKYCAAVGADMLMVLPPDWAGSTTVDSLVNHYRAVAQHIPVMMVTNYLAPHGIPFAMNLIERLIAEVPRVMALKDDLCGEFARRVCLLAHDHWAISAGGQKQNHMNMLPYGVDGYLSTLIACQPKITWKYWEAARSGNLEVARDVIRRYDMPLFDYLLKSEGSFDAAWHGVLELAGLVKRYRRPPYHTLTDRQMDDLAEFLKSRELL